MLKSTRDFLPAWIPRGEGAVLAPFGLGDEIVFNLSGSLVSGLIIYVVVVWLPETLRRSRVRRSLAKHYNAFKEQCIPIYFSALREPCDFDLLERLKDRNFFRTYFNEKISEDQNRWHGVLNGLSEDLVKRLAVELEILMTEVQYALTVIDIENPDAFGFLKRLGEILYRNRNWTAGYDDVKQLSTFMWSVHTGWSAIHGYTERDIIADMIEAI